MTRRRTLPQIEERHRDEIRAMIRDALERTGWRAQTSAGELGISEERMRRLIASLGLGEEYAERNPGRGRPPLNRP